MTTEDLLRQRLTRQHLTAPTDPDSVCRDLIALQAQYWRNAAHALRIRSNAEPEWDMLGKTWSLRGTLHLCREADLSLLLYQGRKHFLRPQDRCDDAVVYLDGTLCLTAERKHHWMARIPALIDAGIDERDALRDICAAEGMTEAETRCVFDPWGGLLRGLCEEGVLLYRAQERKAFRRCAAFDALDEAAAGPLLATRYFTHYGPASVKDAATFFGVTQATIRRWAATLPLQRDECCGMELFSLPCSVPVADIPNCILLAGFDPLLMGYDKQTNPILPPEHLRKVYTTTGIVHPTILLRGRIVGRWKPVSKRVELTPFEMMSSEDKILVESAVGGDVKWRDIL